MLVENIKRELHLMCRPLLVCVKRLRIVPSVALVLYNCFTKEEKQIRFLMYLTPESCRVQDGESGESSLMSRHIRAILDVACVTEEHTGSKCGDAVNMAKDKLQLLGQECSIPLVSIHTLSCCYLLSTQLSSSYLSLSREL